MPDLSQDTAGRTLAGHRGSAVPATIAGPRIDLVFDVLGLSSDSRHLQCALLGVDLSQFHRIVEEEKGSVRTDTLGSLTDTIGVSLHFLCGRAAFNGDAAAREIEAEAAQRPPLFIRGTGDVQLIRSLEQALTDADAFEAFLHGCNKDGAWWHEVTRSGFLPAHCFLEALKVLRETVGDDTLAASQALCDSGYQRIVRWLPDTFRSASSIEWPAPAEHAAPAAATSHTGDGKEQAHASAASATAPAGANDSVRPPLQTEAAGEHSAGNDNGQQQQLEEHVHSADSVSKRLSREEKRTLARQLKRVRDAHRQRTPEFLKKIGEDGRLSFLGNLGQGSGRVTHADVEYYAKLLDVTAAWLLSDKQYVSPATEEHDAQAAAPAADATRTQAPTQLSDAEPSVEPASDSHDELSLTIVEAAVRELRERFTQWSPHQQRAFIAILQSMASDDHS